jgi:hypothetical protein
MTSKELEELWRKTNDELSAAAERFNEYDEAGQRAILTEIERRKTAGWFKTIQPEEASTGRKLEEPTEEARTARQIVEPTVPRATVAGSPRRAEAVLRRYRDAYRVANTIVAIGTTIKVVGAVVAAAVFLFTGSTVLSLLRSNYGLVIVGLVGAIPAAIIWLLFWLFGVLASAQGQVLLASLDGAVNTSPFLTDDQRADAMSIA